MKLKIPETSTEYVVAEITSPQTIDEGWPVKIALIPKSQKKPVVGDWVNAEWEGSTIRLLVGPGTSKILTCGAYELWVQIDAAPESAVRYAGDLVVV